MEYLASRTRFGAIMSVGEYQLEAGSPHIDRGVVRATLTVSNGSLLYRDTVNLTSSRRRLGVVKTLADLGVEIDQNVLIALDEACRRKAPDPPEKKECDGGVDVSETVPDLAALKRIFGEFLLIADDDYLAVLTAAVMAHRLGFEPVWPLIVGPPGGTKTEPIRSLYGFDGIYPLSSLTPRTFASGLDTGGDDPSLLARLSEEIIVFKDLTTLLTIDRDARAEVFSQLREIYDGEFVREWGTGKRLEWQGRLGFIAGVTDVIDQHHAALAVLGERFLLFRLASVDRPALAKKAMANAGKEGEMRARLAGAMHAFLAGRSMEKPAVGIEAIDHLVRLADFVTRARSGVFRDGFKRELEYVPEPEVPTRFAKQMLALGSGLAVVNGNDHVGPDELRVVHRVGLDCIPSIRRKILKALAEGEMRGSDNDSLDTSKIAGASRFSTSAVRRTLEDLHGLGVVEREKGGPGKADRWSLDESTRSVFETLTQYSEMSEAVDISDVDYDEEPSQFVAEYAGDDFFDDRWSA